MKRGKTKEARFTFRQMRLEGAEHEVTVLMEEGHSNRLVEEIRSGRKDAVLALLQSLAGKLIKEESLTQAEQSYLAESLLEVVRDLHRYGRPFGYKQQRGRPAVLSPWREFMLGRAIDRIHRPERYGREHEPLPLTGSRQAKGAYEQAGTKLGVSDSTARRTHEKYLRSLASKGE